ncbi:hypothetical protein M3084_09290, partial [Succinatimonas hippei]|uniref:hypothetical protein n=1 Tax=Succinatimonas hippei TaxID=626938 RepID=UPI00201363C4
EENTLTETLEKSQVIFNDGIKNYQENLRVTRKKLLDNKKLNSKEGQEEAQSAVKELNFLNEITEAEFKTSVEEINDIFKLPDDLKEADEDAVVKNNGSDPKLNPDDGLSRVDLTALSVKKDKKQTDHKEQSHDLNNTQNEALEEKDINDEIFVLTAENSANTQDRQQPSANLALESWLNAYSPDLPQFESPKTRKKQ